jgi:hypothetical protein
MSSNNLSDTYTSLVADKFYLANSSVRDAAEWVRIERQDVYVEKGMTDPETKEPVPAVLRATGVVFDGDFYATSDGRFRSSSFTKDFHDVSFS